MYSNTFMYIHNVCAQVNIYIPFSICKEANSRSDMNIKCPCLLFSVITPSWSY